MKKEIFFPTLICMIVGTSTWADDFKKSTPALVEQGKTVYTTNCLTCHGDKGDGMGPAGQYMNPKPRSFAEGKFKNGGSLEQLFKSVTKGLDGTSMAGFGQLTEQERWAVVHYIRTFKTK